MCVYSGNSCKIDPLSSMHPALGSASPGDPPAWLSLCYGMGFRPWFFSVSRGSHNTVIVAADTPTVSTVFFTGIFACAFFDPSKPSLPLFVHLASSTDTSSASSAKSTVKSTIETTQIGAECLKIGTIADQTVESCAIKILTREAWEAQGKIYHATNCHRRKMAVSQLKKCSVTHRRCHSNSSNTVREF